MKTPKKLTALVLAGALLGSSIAAAPASAKTFSDVPPSHWAYYVIDKVSDKATMIGTGDGVFSPSSNLTRAEYAAILANLAPNKDNGSIEATYTDVAPDAWYAGAVKWAVSNGIIDVEGNLFKPSEPMTRELMAEMTYRFVYKNYVSQIVNDGSAAGYSDADKINDKYEKAVNVLSHNKLLVGRGDNKFEPQGTLTRAEAAAMASRMIDIADKAGDPSEKPEEPEQPGEPSDPEKPSEPSEPEQPTDPEEPNKPSEPSEDPNDSSNWDLDGAPAWFLVGQPDNITDEQWQKLITYYADKERPENANYPSSIKALPTAYQKDEELAKKFCGARMKYLYDIMQADLAEQAMAESTTLGSEEQAMVDMVNKARREAGVPELKVSKALCDAAEIRAEEVVSKVSSLTKEEFRSKPSSYFHSRLDGSAARTVLTETSLNEFYDNYKWGENLVRGYQASRISASKAFESLWSSKSHKENMLNPKYTYMGVAQASDGTHSSWIQAFGTVQ